jgi:hypothetical protein
MQSKTKAPQAKLSLSRDFSDAIEREREREREREILAALTKTLDLKGV